MCVLKIINDSNKKKACTFKYIIYQLRLHLPFAVESNRGDSGNRHSASTMIVISDMEALTIAHATTRLSSRLT